MTAGDDVLEGNAAYAAAFDKRGLSPAPARKLVVIACMDARFDPLGALGLDLGDAYVLRNAGGVVTDDVIRSLAVAERRGGTEEIVIVAHTDCAMTKFTDEEFRDALHAETGTEPDWSAGTFGAVEARVAESIAQLEANAFVAPRMPVRGFVYDVENGTLREIT
jgi:carbonic anhydrase